MKKIICGFFLISFLAHASSAQAQGTAFTYQGRLSVSGAPANGIFDLSFTLYATNTGGVVLAGPLVNPSVAVTNGLFTTTLDFGNIFVGASNWLGIAVSPTGLNSFITLTPR